MVLPIITGQDTPILRKKTIKVRKVTKELQKLIDDMDATRIASNGAGIAAPQVNRSERIAIAMIGGKSVALINPQILSKSDETEIAEEGCLSLPDVWVNVPRSKTITVRYINEKGVTQELALKNWDARVVQHEVDHLDGRLIVDYS